MVSRIRSAKWALLVAVGERSRPVPHAVFRGEREGAVKLTGSGGGPVVFRGAKQASRAWF